MLICGQLSWPLCAFNTHCFFKGHTRSDAGDVTYNYTLCYNWLSFCSGQMSTSNSKVSLIAITMRYNHSLCVSSVMDGRPLDAHNIIKSGKWSYLNVMCTTTYVAPVVPRTTAPSIQHQQGSVMDGRLQNAHNIIESGKWTYLNVMCTTTYVAPVATRTTAPSIICHPGKNSVETKKKIFFVVHKMFTPSPTTSSNYRCSVYKCGILI